MCGTLNVVSTLKFRFVISEQNTKCGKHCTGPETWRKYVEEPFARNQIGYKEQLKKTNVYPRKQEYIEHAAKEITCKTRQNCDKHWKSKRRISVKKEPN